MIFDVIENTGEVRATNNPFKIRFRDITVVKNIDPPPIEPCNNFTPFETIHDKSVDDTVLVGKLIIYEFLHFIFFYTGVHNYSGKIP